MAEILIIIITLLSIFILSKRLGKKLFFFFIILTNLSLIITFLAHFYIVSYNKSGIATINPHAQDALAPDATIYYETAKNYTKDRKNNFANFSYIGLIHFTQRSTVNLGYHIFNIIAFNLSNDPVLLIRLAKLLIYLLSLISLAKSWKNKYGIKYTINGLFFLSFLYWDIYIYNILNLKDGLILSTCVFIYAQLETLNLLQSPLQIKSVKDEKYFHKLIIISLLLIILASLRFYIPIIILISILISLLFNPSRLPILKLFIIASIFFSTMIYMVFKLGLLHNIGYIYEYAIIYPSYHLKGVLQFFLSPIPWKSTIKLLIPSHILYLIFLPLIIKSILYTIKSKVKWKAILIIISALLIGGIEQLESVQRLRLFIIPLYVSICIDYCYHKSLEKKIKNNRLTLAI